MRCAKCTGLDHICIHGKLKIYIYVVPLPAVLVCFHIVCKRGTFSQL